MPPRKAGPTKADLSPPPAPITAAVFKRKLPGFIRHGESRLAKKKIRFDRPNMLESIPEATEDALVTAFWVEGGTMNLV